MKDAKNQVAPAVERIVTSCYTSLQKYVAGYPTTDPKICDDATETIDKASAWIENVSDLYNESEMYSMDASKSMTIDIEMFTGNGSQTIYEFLNDFESMYRGKGSEKQKVDKLYRFHLSERIRTLCQELSSDFVALKNWLLKEYGDLTTVTDSLVRTVELIPKPSSKDYRARADYFLKIEATLQKIVKLHEQSGIDSHALNLSLIHI